jgi:hypothetical protein
MKVLPFDYQITDRDVARGLMLFRYQPEELISFFNEALFLVVIFLVFQLARRLFDTSVAWISAVVIAGSDLFWKFSVSGLSTLLLMVIFLSVVWCLVFMDQASRESERGGAWFGAMALVVGGLVGLGALTRYSFGWLIFPVLAFVALYLNRRRVVLCLIVFVAFVAVLAPWLARNYAWSGTLFGTAGYAVIEDTAAFPADQLERSLKPDFSSLAFTDYFRKLAVNASGILQNELPKLGGNWISAFFLVGLLVPFVSKALGRMRVFLVLSLVVMTVAQAMGKTHLSDASSAINSENLLVLLAPLVFIYGVGMYSLLLDQVNLPFPQLRHVVTGVVVVLASSPLIFTFLPPREFPLVFPPYSPPWVQRFGRWMEEKELVMSDMPWAMAWYGRRQSVWTTLSVRDNQRRDDFFSINDSRKPIRALYLTTLRMDARLHSQIIESKQGTWERFLLDGLVTTNGLPVGFPLKYAAPGGYYKQGQLFLADWPRWEARSDPTR